METIHYSYKKYRLEEEMRISFVQVLARTEGTGPNFPFMNRKM